MQKKHVLSTSSTVDGFCNSLLLEKLLDVHREPSAMLLLFCLILLSHGGQSPFFRSSSISCIYRLTICLINIFNFRSISHAFWVHCPPNSGLFWTGGLPQEQRSFNCHWLERDWFWETWSMAMARRTRRNSKIPLIYLKESKKPDSEFQNEFLSEDSRKQWPQLGPSQRILHKQESWPDTRVWMETAIRVLLFHWIHQERERGTLVQ